MRVLFLFCCFLGRVSFVNAQSLETISGIVQGADDLENIHVINKTSKTFTITSKTGTFQISAKLNDTLVFSSIQYNSSEVVVNSTAIYSRRITVDLKEHVNTLDEVIVGKILTGNLSLDVGSSEAEPEINFYDVGIPGYKGKRKTKAERDLSGAGGEFKPIMLLGLLGGSLPVDPIINGITGRTKKLKKRIALERNNQLRYDIRQRLSDVFFSEHPLSELKQMDFRYFCSDDPNFEVRCKNERDVEILAYLNEKYIQYNKNLNSRPN